MDWCTIESDPGVFTEIINNIGVQDVKVEEIYDLNGDLTDIEPIYGLIFLFRLSNKIEKRETLQIYDQDLFFANQVISNACATQAIISILLNKPDINIGGDFQNYKEVAFSLNPKDKVRIAHNSFGRPDQIVFYGGKKSKEGDDIFHLYPIFPSKIMFMNQMDYKMHLFYQEKSLMKSPGQIQLVRQSRKGFLFIIAFALLAVCKKQNSPEEQQNFEKYQEENSIRKHNYVHLITIAKMRNKMLNYSLIYHQNLQMYLYLSR